MKPEVRHVLRPGAMLNGPTWGVKDYRFYCIIKLTFFGVFALYSLSMRRNQVKSGISRTSTHHRRMKNIRMLKETKSQVNNLIFSPTGFDRRNITADRTSGHSTIRCRLRSNCYISVYNSHLLPY